MKRPLPAPPRPPGMDEASIFIKDAMAVDNLHLHHRTGQPPVSGPDLVEFKIKALDHPALVILIE